MRALILDMTHGGQVLAKRFLEGGYDVTVVDVYRIAPRDMVRSLERAGARCSEAVPAEHFDLVTMPCHCPDTFLDGCKYDRREWFSQSVNRFMDDKRFRIEVTGVKGKTSTCYLIAHILSEWGKSVYLRTSRGSGPYGKRRHFITDLVSIAPPYLLELPKGEYDVMVCEVSLGGSGKADVSLITNLIEDYGIAKNARKAEEAKKDVLNDKLNIVPEGEVDLWSKYGRPVRGYAKRVTQASAPEFAKPLKVYVEYGGRGEASLDGSYLSLQYLDDMDAALDVCEAMGVDADTVYRALSTFRGVPGRGELSIVNGVRYLRERNPGIARTSVERTLSCLNEMGALDDAALVIDPASKKVCDKLDRDLIREVADRYGVELILTPGDGTEPEIPAGKKTIIRMTKEGYR